VLLRLGKLEKYLPLTGKYITGNSIPYEWKLKLLFNNNSKNKSKTKKNYKSSNYPIS
jgi:hypothetical protein